jgi:hypothetical protein
MMSVISAICVMPYRSKTPTINKTKSQAPSARIAPVMSASWNVKPVLANWIAVNSPAENEPANAPTFAQNEIRLKNRANGVMFTPFGVRTQSSITTT